jgi:hypothetical protein
VDYFEEQQQQIVNDAAYARVRDRMRAQRAQKCVDRALDVEPAAYTDCVAAQPQPVIECTPVHVGILESEVPADAIVHESIESAIASLARPPSAASSKSGLASFARARLRALLMDSVVRDSQLVQAAKALLSEHPGTPQATSAEHTLFVVPSNGRGPLPHQVYLRARAMRALHGSYDSAEESTHDVHEEAS